MPRPLLSAVLIVKDEAASIRQVLESVKPFVDRCTIIDTGSTDGTQDIAREITGSLSGLLVEEAFIDFATTRNRALEIDSKVSDPAVFQLVLSADEYLRNGTVLREYLETHRDTLASQVDCFRIRLTIDETSFYSPRIFRTGSPWRYEGEVHEYPVNRVDANAKTATAPCDGLVGAYIEHIISDPEKRFSNIWENHIPMLKAKLEDDPEDERALTFLAKSYESLFPYFNSGERITYAMEVMGLYLRRLALPTASDAEKNFIRMSYLSAARMTGVYSESEMLVRCQELQKDDPHRPETALLLVHAAARVLPATQIYELARKAAEVANAASAIENESPVSTTCEWKAHLIAASAAKTVAAKAPDAVGTTENGEERIYADLALSHIEAGIAAGGPVGSFEAIREEMAEIIPAAVEIQVTASQNAAETDAEFDDQVPTSVEKGKDREGA